MTAVADLAAKLRGDLLDPAGPSFDEARLPWNVRLDRRPDLIARCLDAADVQAVVDASRAEGWQLSVKGGGHSYAAACVRDGGILVDLSPMKAITVDAAARTATIGGAVTAAELDAATQEHGLATTTPTVSSVGVVGAALGGGSGYLARAHGLTLDNLISAQVVTADGTLVHTSATEHPDLFWALRGGGGNFGIVTSAELRLHDVGPEVLAGQIIYPIDRAGEMLRFFRTFMAEAPNEFQCYPFMFRIPPIDAFPAETHGQPVLDFVLYHRDPAAAAFVQPLRKLGDPLLDAVAPGPYATLQQAFDASLPKGQRYLSKAHNLDELSDAAIDTVLAHVSTMTGAFTAAYFDPLGGAIAQVSAEATAYRARQTPYGFHCVAGWMDAAEDKAVISWASQLHEDMAAHASGSVYVNLIADDEVDRVPAAYGENYGRLVELKRTWDPDNLFQANYNIPPNSAPR
jgi:FAD binding domain/Berberine and berberine like